MASLNKAFCFFLCLLLIEALFILPSTTARTLEDISKPSEEKADGAVCGKYKYGKCIPKYKVPKKKCKYYKKCKGSPPSE